MEIIITILSLITIVVFLFWFKKELEQKQKEHLKSIYNELLNDSMIKLSKISQEHLQKEKETISVDLKNKKESIESMIKRIEQDLQQRHKELVDARTESIRHFADVKRQIEEHAKITEDLRGSTDKLKNILSHNQLRGSWGEKILEDILNNAGLEKGIHYIKQETLASGVKPDIILLLPEKKKISIDAKFPMTKVISMANITEARQLSTLKKEFEQDVKVKIKEICKREYINSEEGTLDFAIMFVPSEMIFSFINKEFPAVLEEAFSKKIIIASPFSLYAIARTIMQGYKNYYYEQNIKEVLEQIGNFKFQYEKFKEEFDKLGRSFETAAKDYTQISTTRFNQMERVFGKIEQAEKDSKLQGGKIQNLID
jgi:DNA recombination protein RmuC